MGHDHMETLYALQSISEENPRSPANFPHKEPVIQTFNIFFIVNLNKLLNKQ